MAVLTAAINEALSGKGQLAMLAGEPGIGNTRLAQELASVVEQRGARVLGAGGMNKTERLLLALGSARSLLHQFD